VRWRKGAACLMVAMLSGPAVADALLPIGGAFGDEAGCEFFMTGEAGSGSFAVVTPDTFTTESIACYFESLISEEGEDIVLEASCGKAKNRITVSGSPAEGYFVFVPHADVAIGWGRLSRCPGTEELFKPLGLPV
jgi:hypothetical protein